MKNWSRWLAIISVLGGMPALAVAQQSAWDVIASSHCETTVSNNSAASSSPWAWCASQLWKDDYGFKFETGDDRFHVYENILGFDGFDYHHVIWPSVPTTLPNYHAVDDHHFKAIPAAADGVQNIYEVLCSEFEGYWFATWDMRIVDQQLQVFRNVDGLTAFGIGTIGKTDRVPPNCPETFWQESEWYWIDLDSVWSFHLEDDCSDSALDEVGTIDSFMEGETIYGIPKALEGFTEECRAHNDDTDTDIDPGPLEMPTVFIGWALDDECTGDNDVIEDIGSPAIWSTSQSYRTLTTDQENQSFVESTGCYNPPPILNFEYDVWWSPVCLGIPAATYYTMEDAVESDIPYLRTRVSGSSEYLQYCSWIAEIGEI